jgi:hypothetical protein
MRNNPTDKPVYSRAHYCYAIETVPGFVKIGTSVWPSNRFRDYSGLFPGNFYIDNVIGIWATDSDGEKTAHNHFSAHHIRMELFMIRREIVFREMCKLFGPADNQGFENLMLRQNRCHISYRGEWFGSSEDKDLYEKLCMVPLNPNNYCHLNLETETKWFERSSKQKARNQVKLKKLRRKAVQKIVDVQPKKDPVEMVQRFMKKRLENN